MSTQQQTVLRVQFDNTSTTTSGVIEYEFLDLYGDVPIKINKSFAELQDISKRNSDFSIGLTLPGSKKNNRFFENFFNVDAQSLYFNVLQRVNCQVLLNDQSYFTGFLRLNKVSVLDSKVEYDVTLYSSVGDLFGKIGNNLLKDLNFDEDVVGYDYKFNHTFDKFEVSRWSTYNPYQGTDEPLYFYPIVHNGYIYSGDTVNLSGNTPSLIVSGVTRLYTTTKVGSFATNAAAYAAGVKRYRINSPEDGLIDNQLKPALSIRGLITLMFQNYGYTIKSDFFNTPWFRMLYMYGYFSSEATKFSFKVPPKSDAVSTDLAVKLTETFVDTSSLCGGLLYPKTTRTYKIELVYKDTGVVTTTPTNTNIKLMFKNFSCGSVTGVDVNVPITIPANTTGTTYSWISNQFIPCPVACKLEYKQNFGVNDSLSDVPEYSNLPPNTIVVYEDNDIVDFSLVIDWNLKQIDVLSSIAKKFNLLFIPDPDVPNQIIIEPYNYYIGTGNIHDWTPKLSYDKGFTVEPALNYVESELILTDQEDGDYGNKTFKDRNNRLYGENKVYNPTAFKSQTKKIDTVFSPELVRQWDTPDTAPNGNVKLPLGINYSSNSSSQTSGGNEKIVWTYPGVKTKPKLIYWTGNFNPFLDQVGEVFVYEGNVVTNQFLIAESDGDNPRSSNLSPIVGTTMPVGNPDSNKINNDSICNLFNSELPTDLGVTPFSAYTDNDIYTLFYQNRVDNLYDPNTRFLNGYFNLKYSDIQNLKPNDIIKINEQYFTWNKIDGFNLTNPEMTKVELVQTNVNPQTYPTRYFMYYYCDNTSVVFKFKTDMINPSLSKTSFGWSALYDYNVGLLGGNVSGYTTCVRDFQQSGGYIPYYIYEVSESTYNASGIDRIYDEEWFYLSSQYSGLPTDLNPAEFPSDVQTNTDPYSILANIFLDCANFNYYRSTYNILTGSSIYHGVAVTPTPTPTPVPPTPTPTPTPMIGSLILNFDELVNDLGVDFINCRVNSLFRNIRYTDTEGLYTTNLNIGDVVSMQVFTSPSTLGKQISITRRDYTTDDQGGDNGIRDTFITSSGGTSNPLSIIFTATTVSDAYNFEYIVNATTFAPTPTPTPTATPTSTPTPTPTGTPTPTPTPTPIPDGKNLLFDIYQNSPLCNVLKLSTDFGTTFNTITRPSSTLLVDGDLSQDVELTYTFTNTNAYRSTNSGSTWSDISSNLSITTFTKASCSQDGQILSICGGSQNVDNGAYISYNSGNTFSLLSGSSVSNRIIGRNYVTTNGFPMLFVYNDSVGGANDYLKICSSSGSSVQNITGGGLGYWYDASMSDDTKYILAAKSTNVGLAWRQNQTVYLSSNSGTTFTAISFMTGLTLTSCNVSDDGQYMMVTSSGTLGAISGNIWVSTDYGVNWTLKESASSLNIFGGDISSGGKVMAAVGVGGSAYGLWLNQNYGSGSFTKINQTCQPNWVVIGR